MLPNFILPEAVVREDGVGPAIELGPAKGKPILLTLGINRIIEQESLEISIWGSADGQTWNPKPLLTFPQKFYCGTYSLLLDLSEYPEVERIRAQWKMGRWGRGEPKPLFGFFLYAEEVSAGVLTAKA
jgi:hypothetical protein